MEDFKNSIIMTLLMVCYQSSPWQSINARNLIKTPNISISSSVARKLNVKDATEAKWSLGYNLWLLWKTLKIQSLYWSK